MKRFGRFIILAIIGFGLGAAIAYLQVARETTMPAPVAEQQAAADPMPMSAEAAEEAVAPLVAQADAALEGAPAAEQAVAGSTVGGAFSLTDHNGNAVTEKSWPGKYKLVFFGFTRCPDICPAALDKLTTTLNALGTDAEKVQTLFITTDPARDTADVMKTYITASYHSSIVGLTGTEEQINAAKDAYKVYAAKVPGATPDDYSMNHSSYVFLMTPDDHMEALFKSEDTAESMADKIRTVINATSAATTAEPAVVTPASEMPSAETPAADAPAAETSATTPAAETPAVPAPAADTPVETPASETPAPETAAPAETTPAESTVPAETAPAQ